MSIARIYARAIARNLHATANWEPDSERKIGDYGVMDHGVFKYLGNVSSILNTKVRIEEVTISGEKTYQSKGMTHHVSKLDGGIGPDGTEWVKAGLSLNFSGNEAIFFQMTPEKRTRLVNTNDLAVEIISKYHDHYWELDWVVVIETTTAQSGIILLSQEGKTEFQLEAKVSKLEELNLSHPALSFASERQTEQNLNIKLGSPSTPLLSVAKLNRRWFARKPIFRGGEHDAEMAFLSVQAVAAEEMAVSQNTLGDDNQERLVLEEFLVD